MNKRILFMGHSIPEKLLMDINHSIAKMMIPPVIRTSEIDPPKYHGTFTRDARFAKTTLDYAKIKEALLKVEVPNFDPVEYMFNALKTAVVKANEIKGDKQVFVLKFNLPVIRICWSQMDAENNTETTPAFVVFIGTDKNNQERIFSSVAYDSSARIVRVKYFEKDKTNEA